MLAAKTAASSFTATRGPPEVRPEGRQDNRAEGEGVGRGYSHPRPEGAAGTPGRHPAGGQLKNEGGVQVVDAMSQACAMMVGVSVGEDLLEERRRRRRAGDPRLSDADREILRRVTRGDLQPEFQAALDADLAADPLLGGGEPSDQAD
jgi:hypothetical protein